MGLGEKNGGWGVGNEGSSGVSVDSCEGFLQSAKTQRYEESGDTVYDGGKMQKQSE
jgi:hypothetical protein